ncbi:hypothetical protein [Pannonibacter phragmitetus]|uniref:hypothetical protein n=1 Tax=Pannonibacter phragmitetus TaxID=121719 RepID=UPI003D2F15DF
MEQFFYAPLFALIFAALTTPIPSLVLYLISRFIRVTVLNYLLLGTAMGLVTATFAASLMRAREGGFSFTFEFAAVFMGVFLAICLPASLTGAMVFYRQAKSTPHDTEKIRQRRGSNSGER